MATAAASETVSLSRVSRWRKVGVGLGTVSASGCERLLCMSAEGWSLAWQSLGFLGLSGPTGRPQEQDLGVCGHFNSVSLF